METPSLSAAPLPQDATDLNPHILKVGVGVVNSSPSHLIV